MKWLYFQEGPDGLRWFFILKRENKFDKSTVLQADISMAMAHFQPMETTFMHQRTCTRMVWE